MDVTNLYTNITSNMGMKTLKYWINKHPKKIDSRFKTDFILEATEIVLKNNTFNFTMEESQHKISFLDILITHHGEKLWTDIYYKPTDTHQYLHFASSHPRHTKCTIPNNLARRICTIVSEESIRNESLNEMQNYL
jgi:hypothetical protein